MRIEELDMTLRTWPGGTSKRIGHARTFVDGVARSITVCVEGADHPSVPALQAWRVVLQQGPVSVESDWSPTVECAYEQAVLEALEGAPKLARTIADITHAVRMRRQAARIAERLAADQAERDAGVTPIADMHPIEEEGFNL